MGRLGRALPLAVAALAWPAGSVETAVVNLLRHGEKCNDPDSGHGLSEAGMDRAQYLARCMASTSRSPVMPFGRATAVVASKVKKGKSTRPRDTVAPLAEALGLEVQMPCKKSDAACLAEHAGRLLANGGTLVVSWQHEDIVALSRALGAPGAGRGGFAEWPAACAPVAWDEPSCCYGSSTCYDLVWQVNLTRPAPSAEWTAASMRALRQGFAGKAAGPCGGGLAPEAVCAWGSSGRGGAHVVVM